MVCVLKLFTFGIAEFLSVKAWIHLGVVARQWFYFIYTPNLWFILFIAVIVAWWFAKTHSLFVLTIETDCEVNWNLVNTTGFILQLK